MELRAESLKELYLKHGIAAEFADGNILKFIQEEYMLLISDIFKGNKEGV